MNLNDAFRTLGVPKDATAAEVKAAYRRLVSTAHPDRGGEAAEFIRVRAAYEIVSAFLHDDVLEDEFGIPAELRAVIERIVRDFRENRRWAEEETLLHLKVFEAGMSDYIRSATRAELRNFSSVFRHSWNATIDGLFKKCNVRCDEILRAYESWYSTSTQAVFDDIYRRELLSFALRRRFWEIFLLISAVAGALTVVVGWTGPVARWVSASIMVVAAVLSFLLYRWWCVRRRKVRQEVEPLSVVPFQLEDGARFEGERALRQGRRAATAMGVAGLFVGNAAAGGLALPIVVAAAGMALGGVFDRFLNPTARMREGMQDELRRFMTMARSQVAAYVLEAHDDLLQDVRGRIVENYRSRVEETVKLITSGNTTRRDVPGRNERGAAEVG